MTFDHLISGNIGLLHLISSLLAILFGSLVLFSTKGTRRHKKIGYYYCAAMIAVNVTAFMIYRLYHSFGIFHWLAVLSTLTLLGGMIPVIRKKPASYISYHYGFMYWSVMGLYAAFVAETFVRIPDVVLDSGIPNGIFYMATGIGTGIVMGLGAFFFIKNRRKWEVFDKSIVTTQEK